VTVLVTGVAGFIGFHAAAALLRQGEAVVGIDNLNPYYSVRLKRDRLAELGRTGGPFRFLELDFADGAALERALEGVEITRILHLGAQAGVRHSIDVPRAYVQANVAGHLNLLELARARNAAHLVYASSSSVYGANAALPFSVEDRTDNPVSLYGATKRADELMSEAYAHLFRLPQTGLRFFTVYGPWGRPDMAVWLFTDAILRSKPIRVFNAGAMRRDFTFVDDAVRGIVAALDRPPPDDGALKPGGSLGPHRIYNIGNNRSEQLDHLIDVLEEACGKRALRELMPMQPGDLKDTAADIAATTRDLGFRPSTPIEEGVPRFVEWFRAYGHGNPPLERTRAAGRR
jgi:UDP-glucuronate 4-epimerase